MYMQPAVLPIVGTPAPSAVLYRCSGQMTEITDIVNCNNAQSVTQTARSWTLSRDASRTENKILVWKNFVYVAVIFASSRFPDLSRRNRWQFLHMVLNLYNSHSDVLPSIGVENRTVAMRFSM